MTTATLTVILSLVGTTPEVALQRPGTGPVQDTAAQALTVLAKADEATKAVQTVRYKARAYPTNWLENRIPAVEGTAVITGTHDVCFQMARFETMVRFPRQDGVQELTYAADGTFFYLLDADQKLVYEGMDRKVTGQAGRAAQQIGLREFVLETPFSDEIHADSVSLRPETRVGKVRCYVVDVVYAKRGGHAVWYFSKTDYLPRRVDRVYENRAGEVAMFVVELYDLEMDPEIAVDDLRLSLPDGFAVSSRAAPDVRNLPR